VGFTRVVFVVLTIGTWVFYREGVNFVLCNNAESH